MSILFDPWTGQIGMFHIRLYIQSIKRPLGETGENPDI